jgi:hypothetical protein
MRKGNGRGMLKHEKPTKLRERPYLVILQSKFATKLCVFAMDSCNKLFYCRWFVLQNSESLEKGEIKAFYRRF